MDHKNSTRITITITLSDKEHQYITAQANKCGVSKASFIREAVLSGQVVNSLSEAQFRSMMAKLYTIAEQVEDASIRTQLKKGADAIWQYLK